MQKVFGQFIADGDQGADNELSLAAAWAVRDGDVVSPVPIPAALPLFLTALAGLVFAARRRRPTTNGPIAYAPT